VGVVDESVRYNTASFSAPGALRPANRGGSFCSGSNRRVKSVAQLLQQGSGTFAGTGRITPPCSAMTSFGLSAVILAASCSPQQRQQQHTFALSAAASGSEPLLRELPPVPTVGSTAAVLAACC
jgi:hypothetical protein